MITKEKAIELVNKFYPLTWQVCEDYEKDNEQAKQCALIAVDEIIKSNPCFEDSDRGGNLMYSNNSYYWQQVKEEINKL